MSDAELAPIVLFMAMTWSRMSDINGDTTRAVFFVASAGSW